MVFDRRSWGKEKNYALAFTKLVGRIYLVRPPWRVLVSAHKFRLVKTACNTPGFELFFDII